MLTFQFNGADGHMSESETLTSGMIGKEARLIFDDGWNDLTKTVVFRAGDITRVVMNPAETVVIPESVLARPFSRLYVGAYGTDEAGELVIPTVMVEGPMISYGADPMTDDTADELPVWKKMQELIGLTVNLETVNKANLVCAINELLKRINILTDDLESIRSQKPVNPIHHWDFRSGNLVDRIGELEAVTSDDVTLDESGAHLPTASSYLMFPAGAEGASLAGHTAEIKFGEMTLADTAPMRLLLISGETQPASMGLQWSVQRCWSTKSSLVTDFTDLQMFSGKTLMMKANADSSLIEWFIDGKRIVSLEPTIPYTHLSIGSTANGAFPLTVEQIRIYKN